MLLAGLTQVGRALKHCGIQPQEMVGMGTGTGMEGGPYQGGICRTCQVPRSPAFPSPHPVKAPESGQASGRCSLLSGPADRQGSPNLRGREGQGHGNPAGAKGGTAAGDTPLLGLTNSRQAHPLHSTSPEPGRMSRSPQYAW